MSGSKVGNATKALTGQEMWPDIKKNMFFKVPSFARNLNGLLNAVTSDSWMGIFSGIGERQVPKPEYYHPISVMTRAAAQELGWKPAEAQAAVWVFTRTLAEKSFDRTTALRNLGRSVDDVSAHDIAKTLSSDHMKVYADDFADIMKNDGETRSLLQRLGVKLDKLDEKLGNIGHPEVAHGIEGVDRANLAGAADRVQRARAVEDKLVAKPTAEVPTEGEGSTDFDPAALEGKEGEVRAGRVISDATQEDIAQMANWQSQLHSRAKIYEGANNGLTLHDDPKVGALADRADDAAGIAQDIVDRNKRLRRVPSRGEKTMVAKSGRKVVGAIHIDSYGIEKGQPIFVDYLTVDPDIHLGNLQEKGVGTELMHNVIKMAAEHNVGVRLKALPGAKSFYSKLGMKLTESLGDSWYSLTPEEVKALASTR